MRLYIPATLDEFTAEVDAARWAIEPRPAHALTPALRASLTDEDEEGLEFAAWCHAAADSLALIAARSRAPHQRLVVTVEVPDSAVRVGVADGVNGAEVAGADAQSRLSAVELIRPVTEAIVCAHVDEPAAAGAIGAFLAASTALGAEDEAVEAAWAQVEECDLLWYDGTEMGALPRV